MRELKAELAFWACVTNATLWAVAGNYYMQVAWGVVGFVFFVLERLALHKRANAT